MSTWLYEGDPFEPLRFEEPLAKLKARIASEDVFRPLIRRLLIENTHQVTVELNPDSSLADKEAAEEQATLDAKRACVPTLAIGDIPKEAKGIPSDVSSVGATKLLTHDLFTNDILYAEYLLDLKTVPAHLLPLVPLWTRALGRMGTKTKS